MSKKLKKELDNAKDQIVVSVATEVVMSFIQYLRDKIARRGSKKRAEGMTPPPPQVLPPPEP